jgi:mannose-6-phosphate isomerase-like protein (cupin superfamily)
VLFAPLEKMDVGAVAAAQTPWWNRTLGEVNEAVVRLGVMEGDFHWHQHDEEDEFFFVLEGALTIEVQGRAPFELKPGQGVTIPRATPHCPHAHGRTVVLMVEKASVVPTGD